ncbi:WD40-repeat-containing domain protein [Syncephalis plumigaleata]|nr:WD40-repeat-containing domain protein [Syncephalis plumigaleata]
MPAFSHLCARPQSTEIVAASGADFLVIDTSAGSITLGTRHYETIQLDYPLREGHKASISAVAFTNDGSKAATFSDDKVLCIWNTTGWERVLSLDMPKRVNALLFDNTGNVIYAADKFGDVYRVNITHEPTTPLDQPIIGHVSMITDMVISPDNQYLLTADRDEKVRITKTSNTSSVYAFLLGHTKFISALHIPSFAPHLVVSGGGDGYLMVWDYAQAKAVQSIPIALAARPYWVSNDEKQTYTGNFAVRHIQSLPSNKTLVCVDNVHALLYLTWSEEQQKYQDHVSVVPLTGFPMSTAVNEQGQCWVSLNKNDSNDVPFMQCLQDHSDVSRTISCSIRN